MKPQFPVKISYQKFRELVYVAAGMVFKPTAYYPTMDDINSHLYSDDETPVRKPEDDIKYLIWNIIYGFENDTDWHKENPGCDERCVSNLIKYIFRPVVHNGGEPHTYVWTEDDEEDDIFDKETGFDYMQDILTDGKTLQFEIDESITDELYYEILVRQALKDEIKDIDIQKDKVIVNFKKFTDRDSVSASDFNTLYYYVA